MPKSPGEMAAAIIHNLPEKTGKTLEQWVALVRSSGPATRKERIHWLKQEHMVGHVTAQVIVAEVEGERFAAEYDDPAALVDNLYSGPNASLRPVHDALIRTVQALGSDVRVQPCKTYVPFSRARQFGMVKPDSRGKVILGLVLPEVPVEGRLEKAKSLGNDRMTHQIKLSEQEEIDPDVRRWLQAAYERGA